MAGSRPLTELLRPQPLDLPGTLHAAVAKAVVQAVLAVLPELPDLGHEPVAAPVVRQRRVGVGVARRQLGDPTLERLATLDQLALRRGERADLTGAGPAADIALGLLPRGGSHRSLDPHLAAERLPMEEHRGARVGLELARLAAHVVGEEDEALLVGALEQHHPRGGRAVRRRRRDRHRLGQLHPGGAGLLEPGLEHAERIGIRVALEQRLDQGDSAGSAVALALARCRRLAMRATRRASYRIRRSWPLTLAL